MKLVMAVIIVVLSVGKLPATVAIDISEVQHPYPFIRPVTFSHWDSGEPLRRMHSIGQLVRLSQAVIVGEVQGRRIDPDYERTSEVEEEFWLHPAIWLEVEVKNVVWGDDSLRGKTLEIAVPWRFASPETGFSGWMFLSRKVVRLHEALRFTEDHVANISIEGSRGRPLHYRPFIRTNVVELDYWVLLGGILGTFDGDDEKMGLVKEYARISHLWYREREGSAKEMAEMLARMAASPHERLRKDASFDSGRLYRFLSTEERKSLLEDDIPGWIRERFVTLKEHSHRPLRTREEVRTQAQDIGFFEEIASDDAGRMIAVLGNIERIGYGEIREYRDLFLPHIRPLLDHPDADVRFSAATWLGVNTHDLKAVPTLLEAFRDESRQARDWPRILLGLVRTTGQAFPYDYDAPPEKRAAQISAWEEWWIEEGREEHR